MSLAGAAVFAGSRSESRTISAPAARERTTLEIEIIAPTAGRKWMRRIKSNERQRFAASDAAAEGGDGEPCVHGVRL